MHVKCQRHVQAAMSPGTEHLSNKKAEGLQGWSVQFAEK
jgi:hypothetical protein